MLPGRRCVAHHTPTFTDVGTTEVNDPAWQPRRWAVLAGPPRASRRRTPGPGWRITDRFQGSDDPDGALRRVRTSPAATAAAAWSTAVSRAITTRLVRVALS